MGKTQRMTVTLMGGAPWGFRLIGGGALPLTINKIRKKSMAHNLGLLTGDAVLSINGVPVHDKSQDEAIDMMDKSGKSLKLEIFRGDINELNAVEEKPKKPIWSQSKTQETVTTDDDGSTTITTKVTSTTQSSTQVVQEAGPTETIMISSEGDVSSEAFQQAVDQASQGLQLSFTEGDVTSSTFEQNSSGDAAAAGLQMSFDVGDMSSSSYDQQQSAVEQGGLQLSFTEGEMTTDTFGQQSSEVDQGLQLSFTEGEMTTNTFDQQSGEVDQGLQLSFTAGDTSTNTVDESSEGLQLSFTTTEEVSAAPSGIETGGFVISVDDAEIESSPAVLEDSGIQLDINSASIDTFEPSAVEVKEEGRILPIQLEEEVSIAIEAPAAEVKEEGRILPIQLEQDLEVESSSPVVMAEPFVESTVIAEEPLKDPSPPAKILTPEPQVITSEAPKTLSPQPPPQIYSPPPQPTIAHPEPEISTDLQVVASPVQPSNTVTTSSQESFDDGQTRREVRQEQHVTTSNDGLSTTMVRQETSSTFSTKQVPGFMQSQESAFSSFQPVEAAPIHATSIHTSIAAVESPPPAEIPNKVSTFSMQSSLQSQPQLQQKQQFTTQYQSVQAPQPKKPAQQQVQPVYQPVAQPKYQAPPQPQPQPVYQPVAQPKYQAPPQPQPQPVYQPVAQPKYQSPAQAPPKYQPVAQPKYQAPPQPQPVYQAPPPTAPKPKPQSQSYATLPNPQRPQPQPQSYATLPNPQRPQPPTTISASFSSNSLDRHVPSFRPSKFVAGFSNKEIPGLYAPGSPKVEIDLNTYSNLYSSDKPQPIQPMFQVRNFVPNQTKTSFKPNMWLSGHKPPSRQSSRAPTPPESCCMEDSGFSKDFETFPVPKMKKENRLTIAQRKDALMNQPMHISRIEDFKNYVEHEDEVDDGYAPEEDVYQDAQTHFDRTHLFAPPVEIHARAEPDDVLSPEGDDDEYYYYEEASSPTSSMLRRKKAQYADSAFYDTPGKHYPTIDEQMKLCKAISTSLTSAANKRARGAKMFLRRKKKANKWVHEGEPGWSSGGDVAELHELDSELQIDDGGSKPLFYFKIPNLKQRVQEGNTPKMSLSQDQFERLRLTAKKCDHRQVAPEASFDIAADLKNHKGRGGRLFEKRKARTDKFVIDETHHRGDPKARLEKVLTQPIKQQSTPWEAAANHAGNVEPAFAHLTQMEQNQKLNQYMKISPPKKYDPVPKVVAPKMPPMPPVVHTSLRGESATLIKGNDFNRSARGWMGGGEYPVADSLVHIDAPARPSSRMSENFGDYNNKVRAWTGPGHTPYGNATQAAPGRSMQQQQQQQQQADYSNYRAQPEWQAHDPEMEELRNQGMNTSFSSSHYEPVAPPTASRPRSRQHSGYGSTSRGYDGGSSTGGGAYGTQYKQEYGYSYMPVDNKFGSGDYNSFNEVKPMYMQPIIPGTDL